MIEAIKQVAGGAQPAGDRALDQTSQAAVGGRLTGEEQHAVNRLGPSARCVVYPGDRNGIRSARPGIGSPVLQADRRDSPKSGIKRDGDLGCVIRSQSPFASTRGSRALDVPDDMRRACLGPPEPLWLVDEHRPHRSTCGLGRGQDDTECVCGSKRRERGDLVAGERRLEIEPSIEDDRRRDRHYGGPGRQHAACFDAAPRPSDGLDGRRESNVKTAAQRFGDLVEPVDHDNFTARVPAGAIEGDTGDVKGPAVAANHLFQPCGSECSLVVGEVSKGVGDSARCPVTTELPFDDPRRWRSIPRQAGGVPPYAIVNHIHVGVESVGCGTDPCLRDELKQALVVCRVDDLRAELDDFAGRHSHSTNTSTDAVACFENGDAQACARKGLGASEPGCAGPDDRHVRRVHGTQHRDRAR